MSKSTPISQIPTDTPDDDDIAVREVQEVLNQISQSESPPPPVHRAPAPAQRVPETAAPPPPPEAFRQHPTQQPPQTFYYPLPNAYVETDLGRATSSRNILEEKDLTSNASAFSPAGLMESFNVADIRTAVLVMIVCAVVYAFPVEDFITKYLPATLQNISHTNIIVKAIVAGGAFYVVSKYV